MNQRCLYITCTYIRTYLQAYLPPSHFAIPFPTLPHPAPPCTRLTQHLRTCIRNRYIQTYIRTYMHTYIHACMHEYMHAYIHVSSCSSAVLIGLACIWTMTQHCKTNRAWPRSQTGTYIRCRQLCTRRKIHMSQVIQSVWQIVHKTIIKR